MPVILTPHGAYIACQTLTLYDAVTVPPRHLAAFSLELIVRLVPVVAPRYVHVILSNSLPLISLPAAVGAP